MRLNLDSDDWRGHFVYMALGSKMRRPLYIGRTYRLRQRIGFHIARAPWIGDAVAFEFYRFENVEDAADAELQAILDLNPVHNNVRAKYRGGPISTDDIEPDQLNIIRHVQRRGKWSDEQWGTDR
jgi:hypothetical protein